jgi:hypothetical protein
MTIEERYAHWGSIIETQKTSGSSICCKVKMGKRSCKNEK